jgi:hypothetical protein
MLVFECSHRVWDDDFPRPIPVVTVSPTMITIPSTTPLGTTVATITVVMSDNSPYTGGLTFGSPNFDDGGIYSISGTSTPFLLLVNPSGPGVGAQGGSVDHVTVVATQ